MNKPIILSASHQFCARNVLTFFVWFIFLCTKCPHFFCLLYFLCTKCTHFFVPFIFFGSFNIFSQFAIGKRKVRVEVDRRSTFSEYLVNNNNCYTKFICTHCRILNAICGSTTIKVYH